MATGDIRTKIRDILGAFMFGGEASDKKVKVLSGGEKTRLAMIRLLLEPVNLLILDEPTNHLDMQTKDVLKQAIQQFDGTVIVVSHDREFLDGLVDKVYEFGGGRVRECLGGIYEFLEKKKISRLQELELSKSPSAARTGEKETRQAPSPGKNTPTTAKTETPAAPAPQRKSYQEMKEMEKLARKARKKIADAEAAVAAVEEKLKAVEDRFAAGESSEDLIKEHAALKKEQENAMSLWELAVMEGEQFGI